MVGFYVRNQDNIDIVYHCPICSLILRDPVQLICSHRQCKTCVEYMDGETIKCSECQQETQKKDVLFDRGCKNDMQRLFIICLLCDWNGLLKDYEDHFIKVHPNPACEYCDKLFHSMDSLSLHKLKECDKIIVICPLKDFGCSDSILKIHMSEHYKGNQHQNAIINFIYRFIFKSSHNQFEIESKMDIDNIPHSSTTITTFSYDRINKQLLDAYETIDVLASGIQTLNDDVQHLTNESVGFLNTMNVLTQDFASLKLSTQEQNTVLDGFKFNQEILHQDVASLKQQAEDMQFVSYDGTLIWKITNVKEKIDDAKSERQTSLYSPSFYSSRTGYKMKSRLYLNGDGSARGTHISLFFVLMKSSYDPILTFPFNYKITFVLYDQTPAQHHIIDSFRPDIKSNSFQRPQSEMNIASGIPKFVSLSTIEQEGNPYVRNDTMFIKIMVDFIDMPKTLLPYLVSLNPGLPINTQQSMTKQEAERRIQQNSTSSSNLTASESVLKRNE